MMNLSNNKTAVISGAGISGLATAYELAGKGYDVTVVEERESYSRFNVINLNKEVQVFLRKHHLLEEFENSVAARIHEHKVIHLKENTNILVDQSDVSELNHEAYTFGGSETFKDLFDQNGIYSVKIKDLQTFLADRVSKLGVKILRHSEIKSVDQLEDGRVTQIEISQKDNPSNLIVTMPNLFFIAEGAHSSSARTLNMVDESQDIIQNACSQENWIFGNLDYQGEETFVISLIITVRKTLEIANVIFNAKAKVVNVAVTSKEKMSREEIYCLVLDVAEKAFELAKLDPCKALNKNEIVNQPVKVANNKASICSKGNVFRIGDAVGHSSPLAGLGGTLGLTLVPHTVEKLIKDIEEDSEHVHENFHKNSQAYVQRWIDKSLNIKNAIMEIANNET